MASNIVPGNIDGTFHKQDRITVHKVSETISMLQRTTSRKPRQRLKIYRLTRHH